MNKEEDEKPKCKKRFVTVPEAAEELGISERTVWREIEEGRLKVHRFGNSTRILREDLDDYIRRGRE